LEHCLKLKGEINKWFLIGCQDWWQAPPILEQSLSFFLSLRCEEDLTHVCLLLQFPSFLPFLSLSFFWARDEIILHVSVLVCVCSSFLSFFLRDAKTLECLIQFSFSLSFVGENLRDARVSVSVCSSLMMMTNKERKK